MQKCNLFLYENGAIPIYFLCIPFHLLAMMAFILNLFSIERLGKFWKNGNIVSICKGGHIIWWSLTTHLWSTSCYNTKPFALDKGTFRNGFITMKMNRCTGSKVPPLPFMRIVNSISWHTCFPHSLWALCGLGYFQHFYLDDVIFRKIL